MMPKQQKAHVAMPVPTVFTITMACTMEAMRGCHNAGRGEQGSTPGVEMELWGGTISCKDFRQAWLPHLEQLVETGPPSQVLASAWVEYKTLKHRVKQWGGGASIGEVVQRPPAHSSQQHISKPHKSAGSPPPCSVKERRRDARAHHRQVQQHKQGPQHDVLCMGQGPQQGHHD
jgi:hypothetical protein